MTFLVPRRLFDENLLSEEGGKEKTGQTRLASPLSPSHSPLHFVKHRSLFVLASQRKMRCLRRMQLQ